MHVVGVQKNRLTETVLLSTHNICLVKGMRRCMPIYFKKFAFLFVSHWQFNFQYLTGDRGLLPTDADMAHKSQEDISAKL